MMKLWRFVLCLVIITVVQLSTFSCAISEFTFDDQTQFQGNVNINSGDGMMFIGGTVTIIYNQYDDIAGKYIETEWTGTITPMSDAFKGWDENGNQYQYIYFGCFMQETGDDDPILWRVLTVDRRSNRVLLLSDKILYAHTYGSSIWENSDVNYWLHNTFLPTAFSETERSVLYSSNSRGTVFILSKDDYLNPTYGFSKDTEVGDVNRTAESTTYARDSGLIRGPFYTLTARNNTTMYAVMSTGRIQLADCDRVDVGIRPAMWIDLSNAEFNLTGDGTLQYPFMVYEKQ